ncbi:hypothetical protein H4582DRAFT_1991185 [Lactarius indigo]|nr:hypothetical protein H4582DRAFT_1991185 [Lactarius indigo]
MRYPNFFLAFVCYRVGGLLSLADSSLVFLAFLPTDVSDVGFPSHDERGGQSSPRLGVQTLAPGVRRGLSSLCHGLGW